MKSIQNILNNGQFISVDQSMQEKKNPVTKPSIVRRKSQLLALEARLMFDGAAVADVVHQMTDVSAQVVHEVDTSSDGASRVNAHEGSHVDPLSVTEISHGIDSRFSPETFATQIKAQRLVTEFFSTPDALQKLFSLFNGGLSEPNQEWLQAANAFLDALRQGDAWCNVELRSNAELHGANGAFAAQGVDGKAVIYLNADWLNSGVSEQSVLAVIAEEIGHSIDAKINGSRDTAGDEGQRFSANLLKLNQGLLGFAQDNDHRNFQIDGVNVEVELANYTFINAYRVNVATTPAGKESNTHDIIFTSLGQTTVNDDTNSELFSGNDVSAVGLNIGGLDYYGWISRPIKVGGVVKAFYFWYDADFSNLAAAQADGNHDGDGNVADNNGFILVVDQSYFDSLSFVSGLVNIKNVGSSSDRVDAGLNDLIINNAKPVAVSDTATAVEKGGVSNATAGSNASGNVLTNDTDATVGDTKTLTKVGTTSANQVVASNSDSTNGTVVNGQYGALTIGADGSFQFVINNSAATIEALRTNANTLTDTFTYTMVDKAGATSTTTLTVTIQGANDNPVASNDYNTAKESLLTDGTAYSGTDLVGAKATGNVLGNDTDVDRNGETKTVGNLAGSLIIGSYSTSSSAATLIFTPGTTFNPVGNGDEAWYKHTDGTYRAIFTASTGGTQVTATGPYNSTTREIPLNGTPAYYYDASGRVAITDLNNVTIGFKNDTSTTTTTASSMKEGVVSSSLPSDTSTIAVSGTATGVVAVGMTVTGTGVTAGTKVVSIGYDGSGHPTSVILNSIITSTNGSTLTFTGTLGTSITGQYGSLVLNSDGSYVYTPLTNNGNLNAGATGVDIFPYTVSDASGATSTANLNITVYGSSATDPNAIADTATAVEAGGVANATAGTNPTGNVLSNDTTPSGTNSVVSARALGSSSNTAVTSGTGITGQYGSLSISSTGAYTYTLDNSNSTVQALRTSSDTLTETFIYVTQNTGGGQDATTLTVTIQGANDAPLAVNDSATAIEAGGINNGTAGFNPTGNVLSNDSDVDDAASALAVTNIRTGSSEGAGTAGTLGSALSGTYGSLTMNSNGTWSYIVDNSNSTVNALSSSQTLTDSFNYTVKDAATGQLSDIGVLTVTIQGANDTAMSTTIAVNNVLVNEASPYAIFTVTGNAGLSVSLSIGNTTGLAASDVKASLAGVDVSSSLEYFNGTSWVAYDGVSATIPAGGSMFVRTAISQDAVDEGNESFTLTATNLSDSSAVIGIGTINDEGEGDVFLAGNNTGTPNSSGDSGYPSLDDDRPTFSITSPNLNEGSYATFTVSIDKTSTSNLSFTPVLTGGASAGIATIGTDTTAGSTLEMSTNGGTSWTTVGVSNPVSIAAGQSSIMLRLATTNDGVVEPTETFTLGTGYISGTAKNPSGVTGTATITDGGSGPSAVADTATASEAGGTANGTAGTDPTGNVKSNDTGSSITVTKAQAGTSLTGGASSVAAGSTSASNPTSITGSYGSLTIGADGTYQYTVNNSNATVQALQVGSSITDSFSYEITDNANQTTSTTLVVTINGANDAPVVVTPAVNQTASVGNSFSYQIPAFSDVDAGDTITYSFTGSLPNGITFNPATRTFSGVATATMSSQTIVVTGTDSKGVSTTTSFLLNAIANVPAVFSGADTGSVTEDSGNYIASGNLTVTDSDSPNTIVANTSVGTYGSFTINSSGAWSYTADNSKLQVLSTAAQAQESFTVTAADGTTHTVVVTLNGVNDAPTSSNGSISTAFGTAKSGSLPGSTDVDTGHSVSYTKASDPAHGSVSINANGSYTYTPAAGYSGADSFSFQVSDGHGGSNTYSMNITVAPNVPAVFSGTDTGSVTEDSGNYVASGTLVVSDSDGANTVVAQTTAGTYGSFSVNANGTWSYTADNDKLQVLDKTSSVKETFIVTAADGTTHTVVISLNGVDEVIPPKVEIVTPIVIPEVHETPTQVETTPLNPVGSQADSTPVNPINDVNTIITSSAPVVSQDGGGRGGVGDYLLTVADNKAFQIVVTKADEPVLLLFSGIADQAVNPQSGLVGFNVPADAFTHSNPQAVVQLHASLADGANLPKWLIFDATTGRFSGRPPSDVDDDIQVQVIARDTDGREARAVFRIRLGRNTDVIEKNPQAGRSSFSQQLRLAARYSHGERQGQASTYRAFAGK